MKATFSIFILSAFLSFSSFTSRLSLSGTVKGVVVGEDGKPVSGVLVYATAGEEEALTKQNGEFSIETSRKTPFTLTAEHWEYHKGAVTVNDPDKRVTIKLAKKK